MCAAVLAAGTPNLSSPGCTKLSNTFVYTNPDYSTLKALLSLPSIGLNKPLSSLTSPTTLFAPNNEAFTSYDIASNITNAEGTASRFLTAGAELLVVPEAILVQLPQWTPSCLTNGCERTSDSIVDA